MDYLICIYNNLPLTGYFYFQGDIYKISLSRRLNLTRENFYSYGKLHVQYSMLIQCY